MAKLFLIVSRQQVTGATEDVNLALAAAVGGADTYIVDAENVAGKFRAADAAKKAQARAALQGVPAPAPAPAPGPSTADVAALVRNEIKAALAELMRPPADPPTPPTA